MSMINLSLSNMFANFTFTNLCEKWKKVPMFYKIYMIASGITYIYFPQTKNDILINTGILVGTNIVDQIDKYFQMKYPNGLLHNTSSLCNIIFNIGAMGYISKQMNIFAKLHEFPVNIGYIINAELIHLCSSVTYYSAWFGGILFFTGWLTFNITKFILRDFYYGVVNNDTIISSSIVPAAENMIRNLTNLINRYCVVNRNVLTLEEIEKTIPLKCKGLNTNTNTNTNAEPDKCSVCHEILNINQLHRTLPCTHSFHPHCIDEWLIKSNKTCPICRTEIHVNSNTSVGSNTSVDSNVSVNVGNFRHTIF